MSPSPSRSKRALIALVALAAAAVPLSMVAPASAAPGQSSGAKASSNVSPRLESLGTEAKASTSDAQQNAIADLPTDGAGSLLRNADGALLANARLTTVDDVTTAALERAGAEIVASSVEDHLVTVAIEPNEVAAIAGVAGVEYLEEVLEPLAGGGSTEGLRDALIEGGATTSGACVDRITSEADTQVGAASARSTYSVDGTGVRIGVLSDSYNNLGGAATDVSNGELPGAGNPCGRTTPVIVQSDLASGGSDEGRAMAQAVHDLAPGATIAVATAFNGDVDFAQQIRDLAANGATVIVDDISYFNEPAYQDGIIAKAVADVTAAGVVYFSSAANSNSIIGGKDVASYEAGAYRNTACVAPVSGSCHDFDPGVGTDAGLGYTLAPGGSLRLKLAWNEPHYGVATDIDLHLVDKTTNGVVASAAVDNPASSQQPYELLSYTNTTGATRTFDLVVHRYSGAASPRFRVISMRAPGLTGVERDTTTGTDVYGTSSFGHNMTPTAGSIAAIAFDATTAPETFSSRGPVAYCWGPVVGATPAAALPSCISDTIDVTATDGAANSFFGSLSGGVRRFYGTSQSAPHAAAVAVLQRQARPCRTPAQILAAQRSSADPIGAFGVNAIGGGLLDAPGSIAALAACAVTTVPGAPTAVTATPGEGTVDLSWTAPASDGGSAITGYVVTPYIGANAQTPLNYNSTATSQTVFGLQSGTTYTFKVAASNAIGTGAQSAASSAVTPGTVPSAPTNVVGVPSNGQVSVSWNASSPGTSPITGYVVTPYANGIEQPSQHFGTATTQVITGLTNGTPYGFKVAAKNATGTGARSLTSNAVVPGTVPGAPTGLTGTPGVGVAYLSWTAPASNGGSAITGYVVTPYIGANAQTPLNYNTATSQTVFGLQVGTTYTFKVAAKNPIGTGAQSAASPAITPTNANTAPNAPTAVTGTPGNASVALSWTAPSSNGGTAITGYVVTPYIGASAQTPRTYNSAATSQTVTGLANGTTYTFKVAATNAVGTGTQSASSPAYTPASPWAPFASWGAMVDRIYIDMVNRAPSNGERSSWVTQLNNQSATPGDVAAALRQDPDHLNNVDPVTRLYRSYFVRIPDEAGLRYWLGQRRVVRKSLNSISGFFASSGEFQSTYGSLSNRAFVELVYQNVLGRPGEPAGVDYWTSQLDRGIRGRGRVMTGFSESPEYRTAQTSELDVSTLFILLLRRSPTQAEFDLVVAALDAETIDTAGVADEILASQEYADLILS